MKNTFLILGAGNTGLATAALCSRAGHDVLVNTRRKTSLAESKVIHSTGIVAPGMRPISFCSTDLSELADHNGGNLPKKVIIGCRGNDVEDSAVRLAPYVCKEMSICMICSGRFAGLIFLECLKKLGISEDDLPRICEFETAPIVARGNSDDTVSISAFKDTVNIAAQTPEATQRVLEDFESVFPNLRAAKSNLELNLNKADDIVHTPLIISSWTNHEGGQHNIYRTATASTTGLVIKLDRERLSVGEKLNLKLIDMCSGYTQSYGVTGTLLEQFAQIRAYDQAIVQNHSHRYLFEDVPYGLSPLRSFAKYLGVETPLLDALITVAHSLADLPPAWVFEPKDFEHYLMSNTI